MEGGPPDDFQWVKTGFLQQLHFFYYAKAVQVVNKGSIIAYSNEVKMKQLKVSPQTLETYGAVSEQTVAEMARGAATLFEADVAIAISGIAGPGGGSPDKPVGTIWLAVGNSEKVLTRRIYAGKDRLKNIEYSSVHALNFVRQFLLQEQEARISEK